MTPRRGCQVSADSEGCVEAELLTRAFLTVGSGLFLTMVTFGMSLPVLPRLVAGPLDGSSRGVGLAFGAFAIASVGLRPWVGSKGDRLGRRSLVVWGGVVTAAGLVAHVWAESLVYLMLARGVAGAGYGALIVGLMTAGLDMAPEERRGEAANYLMIGMQLGLGLGPVLGELALFGLGYGAVWLIASAIALCAVSTSVVTSVAEYQQDIDQNIDREFVLHSSSVVPGIIALLAVIAFTGFLAFVPLHAELIGMEHVASVLLMSSLLVIGVRLAAGRVVDAVGPGWTVAVGLSLEGLGLLMMSQWSSATGLYVSTVVMSIGWSVVPPSLMFAATRTASDEDRSRSVATFTMLMDSGMAVGPVVLGIVASVQGYDGAFAAGAVVAVVALALSWALGMPDWPGRGGSPSRAT